MARVAVEIGQAFHKTGSPWIIWTVDSFNEFTEPVHARLTRVDDPPQSDGLTVGANYTFSRSVPRCHSNPLIL